MRKIRRKSFTAFGVALALGLGSVGLSRAHDGHDHGTALHGGKVTMTKEYHFEVVFAKDGLKVFPRTHEDQPIDASRLTGTATFFHPNSPKPWFERKLAPSATSPGQAVSSIGSRVDLSKVPATGAKVVFRVEGLPEAAEPTASFTVPLTLARPGELTVAKATQADQEAIDALKVCPVSHEELGSMGTPLKVSRGGRTTFLCCKGCLKELQANPDKFLGAAAAGHPTATHGRHQH